LSFIISHFMCPKISFQSDTPTQNSEEPKEY
jgi:hypothetical protein